MTSRRTFDRSQLRLDTKRTAGILEQFTREELHKAGFKQGVFGLSGGVDSALTAAIAAKALGPEHILGVIMPYKLSNPDSREDALAVAQTYGFKTREIDITPMVDPYFDTYEPAANALRRGNVMARMRMIVLYDISEKERALVLGTSNRTEILLGYSTLWGDSAHAVNPLGDLLKSQIWQMSEYYGLPASVIEKKPSADLWEGQTDEAELGFDYRLADEIITLLVDHRVSKETVLEYGYDSGVVERIMRLIQVNQFKRMPPIIAKLSHRTIGKDFRYPRDWGL